MPKLPDGLPLIRVECPTKSYTFGEGDAFWDGLDDQVGALGLDEILDLALAGRAAPRVWVLAHEPGRPQPAVAGALGLARALAQRGQATLVVDGDDQSLALSRWAGRLDIEGWIDVVRYGTSVVASAVPLPFAGRTSYLMGVGSYAPTEATSAEVAQLLARLRHQADDLLVVLPAGVGTTVWGPLADIRIYCHELADSEERLASDVAVLTGGGFAPTSLLGLGEPVARPPAETASPPVETAGPDETNPAGSEADGESSGVAAPPEEPPAPAVGASAAASGAAPAGTADEGDAAAGSDALRDSVSATLDELSVEDPFTAYADEEDEREGRIGGSSGVFWLIAVVAVVLIAVVTVYYVKFVRVSEQDLFAGAPLDVAGDDLPPAAWSTPPGDSAQAWAIAADTAAVDSAAADSIAVLAVDSLRTGATEPDTVGTIRRDSLPADAGAAAAEPAPAPPVETEGDGAFDMAPYTVPVARDGWALQVYAFRDSASAAVEMGRLERRGMHATVRQVDVPGKGLWWRVYVGSFASRAEAQRAMPALYEKLRIDWANPVRLTE